MLPRGKVHIINIASLGGVLPAEGIATYCATIMPCSDTPTPFAWRTGDAAFTSRRSCRTGGRCPRSRRRDCQAETTCDRSPFDGRRRVGPASYAATRFGGAGAPTGYRARIHQRRRAGQTRIICRAHGDALRLSHRRRRIAAVGSLCTATGLGGPGRLYPPRFRRMSKLLQRRLSRITAWVWTVRTSRSSYRTHTAPAAQTWYLQIGI